MATLKRLSVRKGREIRKATGIDFTLAMRAGKLVARFKETSIIIDEAWQAHLDWTRGCMDEQCSCKDRVYLKGPAGRFQISGPPEGR